MVAHNRHVAAYVFVAQFVPLGAARLARSNAISKALSVNIMIRLCASVCALINISFCMMCFVTLSGIVANCRVSASLTIKCSTKLL